MKTPGHHIYFGNNKDVYINSWAEETETFVKILDVNLTIWEETSILNLIKEYYDNKVLLAFMKIRPFCNKSDLARLLVLYIFGGWYADFGTKFFKKIDVKDAELMFFCDHLGQKLFGLGMVQGTLIYSKPKNASVKYLIDELVEIILREEYGEFALDVTGPARLFRLFEKRKNFLEEEKEFLYDCGKTLLDLKDLPNKFFIGTPEYEKVVEDILTGRPTLVTPIFEIDGVGFALYKNFDKNEKIKSLDVIEADYWTCWDQKIYY